MVTMGITTVAMGISTALLACVLLEGDSKFNDGLSLELENGSENVGKDRENGSENVVTGKACVVSELVDIHGITGQIREWL